MLDILGFASRVYSELKRNLRKVHIKNAKFGRVRFLVRKANWAKGFNLVIRALPPRITANPKPRLAFCQLANLTLGFRLYVSLESPNRKGLSLTIGALLPQITVNPKRKVGSLPACQPYDRFSLVFIIEMPQS